MILKLRYWASCAISYVIRRPFAGYDPEHTRQYHNNQSNEPTEEKTERSEMVEYIRLEDEDDLLPELLKIKEFFKVDDKPECLDIEMQDINNMFRKGLFENTTLKEMLRRVCSNSYISLINNSDIL